MAGALVVCRGPRPLPRVRAGLGRISFGNKLKLELQRFDFHIKRPCAPAAERSNSLLMNLTRK